MIRKLLFTLVWTAVFFLGFLALFLGGFCIAGLYSDSSFIEFSKLWQFTPLVGAVVGFLLGLLGKLPGTRHALLQ